MFPRRPGRATGFSYQGLHRYFLTCCTFNRQPEFLNPTVVTELLGQFQRFAGRHEFAVLAYCFMPDHLHLLVEGLSDQSNLVAFMNQSKQATGYWFKTEYRRQLWQTGYYDHVLRGEERTPAVIRYVLENPVRAGLVERIEAYPFSGSDVYSMEQLVDVWQTQG